MPHALELQDVTAGYGRVEVLHGVTMAVPRGCVVALLGPNGAGKTTTLNAVAGSVAVRRGAILMEGRRLDHLPTHRRAASGVVLVPEGRGVFPGLSVRDNLEVAAQAAVGSDGQTRAAQLERVLEIFPRLRERQRQRAGTMSGGEQQMLAMSRAFLSGPRVLLLDEISMGLAPRVVAQLFEAVEELRAEGQTIVLVEQFLTYALRLADVCYVLSKGRIAFVGEPAELRGTTSMAGYASA